MNRCFHRSAFFRTALTFLAVFAASALGAPGTVRAQAPADATGDAASAVAAAERALTTPPAQPGEKRRGWSFRPVGMIPVQSGGRVKPLDTLARESVLFITGSRTFEGWNAVDLMLSWLTAPQVWDQREFIRVGLPDTRRQLGLDESRKLFSPDELIRRSHLGQYAETQSSGRGGMPATVTATTKPSPRDQELKRVIERVALFRAIVTGEAWPLIPSPSPEPWRNLAAGDPAGDGIRALFARMVLAYRAMDRATFDAAVTDVRRAVETTAGDWSESRDRVMKVEAFYNRAQVFRWSWVLYLLGALIWTFAIFTRGTVSTGFRRLAATLTIAGVIGHIGGMVMRSYVSGRPPVSNMYESIIWVSFGVLVFAAILYWRQRQIVLLAVANACGALALLSADAAPSIMDPGIHPLVPVLRSNYWLTVHVLTITISYSAFLLATGISNVTLFQFLRGGEGSSARILNLNQLNYRALQFGVVLLAAGTILGGVWADYSWGRFWGWDPKEVWALVALLAYLAVLHARYVGWVNQFSFAAWTIFGFMTVVMAWYGVNFVLGAGWHSYGFSTGGQSAVAAFCLLQLAYIGLVALVRWRRASAGGTPGGAATAS
jgi:cytochrome c-type biogenesis protein CcsB